MFIGSLPPKVEYFIEISNRGGAKNIGSGTACVVENET